MEFVFVMFAAGILVLRFVVVISLDKGRIRDDVLRQGGTIIDIAWYPFGKGRFERSFDRAYEVAYRDAGGLLHHATCKTSILTGVYWIIEEPSRRLRSHVERERNQLADENRRLRDELERMKNESRS